MKSLKYIFALILFANVTSCGPSEEKKVCASGVRKEFTDGAVYATVEEGCVSKLNLPNEYKATGSVNLKITESGNTEFKVKLSKGTLITKGGEFIIKSDQTSLKVRLISGNGNVSVGDKMVALERNKVLQMGS